MERDETRSAQAVRRGLTAAFLVSWLLVVADNGPDVLELPRLGGGDLRRVLTVLVLLVAVLPVWVLVGRRPVTERWPAVLYYLLAVTLSLFVTAGLPAFPMIAVGVVLVTLRVGRWAGLVAVGLLGVTVAVALGAFYHEGVAVTVAESVGTMLVMGVVYLFARLLRQVDRAQRRASETNALLTVANTELTEANDRLHAAALVERDLVLAQERARTSRELHDGLGHRLTLVGMSLEYALRARDDDPSAAWGEVAGAAAANRETLDEMRRWVRALHPPASLPETSGPAAFDAIADSFRGTGLQVDVTYEGDPDPPALPSEVSLLAHRAVQEGLTNVLRHSDGGTVTIAMRQLPDLLEVTVRDDGTVGDDPGEGFGRRNLRERAELLGGSVRAGRSPEGGFELALLLPLVGAAT